MTKSLRVLLYLLLATTLFRPMMADGGQEDIARELILESYNYMKGKSSISEVQMRIHRPGWERRVTIRAWTRGLEQSLFFITDPPRDRGNGTLKKGREMWVYNPKVNRVIKLPPSMMGQSWMGSDFSNNDLARSDTIINDYTHSVIATEEHMGKKVYVIRSIPLPEAPVVWGMQELKVREDFVLLHQVFYDEDMQPVKKMVTSEIIMLGGRLFPRVWRMSEVDEEDRYTELIYRQLDFVDSLDPAIFSKSRLKNPRR